MNLHIGVYRRIHLRLSAIDARMERAKQSRVIGISDSVNPPTDPIPDAVMSCYGCNQSGKRQMTLRARYVISAPG